MTTWRIQTSGPGFRKEGTLAQIKAYVERNAPMKRGWTAEWVAGEKWGVWHYVRTNSKGRRLTGYTITIQGAR